MNDGEENCNDCAFHCKRPDMVDIDYCMKLNFPILNLNAGCGKFKRRKENETRRN